MKYILITCDTEVGEIGMEANVQNGFELFVEGKVGNKEAGYKYINTIADKYKAKIDHFVDIYPYEKYGEIKYISLCNKILESGHFLHLHTHPSSKYDTHRRLMHQYNQEEQDEIIAFGKGKIYEWTKREVIAHRAGAYGANDTTLDCLLNNGIKIDSSYNRGSCNCKIQYPENNAISFYRKIFQIPVTTFEKKIKYKPFGIFTKTRIQKLDYRYGSNVKEILNAIKLAPNESVITLFLHSSNFLHIPYYYRKRKFGHIYVDENLIKQYNLLLNEINKMNGVSFTNILSLFELKKKTSDFDFSQKASKFITQPIIKLLKTKLGIIYK